MIKVMMIPSHTSSLSGESGIHTIVRKYAQHFPDYGLELVSPKASSFDVLAVHAGMTDKYGDGPMVAHLHGLYWTADYPPEYWQFKANRDVVNAIRNANVVTVPSGWVSRTIERDMRFKPLVVSHGIDYQEWEHDFPHDGYVLWNKNRAADVCDPAPIKMLAEHFPSIRFLTTFAPPESPPNVKAIGVVPHDKMRTLIQKAWIYLATTKETFGIGTLEAMASGVPVLGYNYGGTKDIVRHEQDGYLAQPGNDEDLRNGLFSCITNRKSMGTLGALRAQSYGWSSVIEQVKFSYELAIERHDERVSVTVVIPCFNKADTLERAVNSVYRQDLPDGYRMMVVIVDNNSTDESANVISALRNKYPTLIVLNERRQGVAHARNAGILATDTKYCCCLDADDEIENGFLRVCIDALEADRSLGLAYTKLTTVMPDGSEMLSLWPSEYDYDQFVKRHNQVPTCCVFRTDLAKRLGGYRQRYAPRGAGSEDAEFFLRMGSIGYGGKLASPEGLFRYHVGGTTTDSGYNEPDWLIWHPWTQDFKHPFASVATPQSMSHKVYQHDMPSVSVVIPVGPGHQYNLYGALDSLEAQTFRRWEAIVVLDCEEDTDIRCIIDAYPYVKFARTKTIGSGAGAARNHGAALANSDFLIFLDADDSLLPDSIENMVNTYSEQPSIIYGDYLGITPTGGKDEVDLARQAGTQIVSYNEDTQEAVILYNAADYDCDRAQRQPSMDGSKFYIWCLICSLVPKAWHQEIGGFDETMESWEDWDYWIRMAQQGKCFTRIMQPIAQYRFYTGTRRVLANPEESGDTGRQVSTALLQYMSEKYKEKEIMPCTGCGGPRRPAPPTAMPIPQATSLNTGATADMSDLVKVKLVDNNTGGHPISVQGTFYQYRKHGDEFFMQAKHAAIEPRVILVEEKPDTSEEVQLEPPSEEVVEEEPVVEIELSLDDIKGIGPARKKRLEAEGINDLLGLLSTSAKRLAEILDTTERAANGIIDRANKKLKDA